MDKVRPWCGQPSDRGRLKNWIELLPFGMLAAVADTCPIMSKHWRQLRALTPTWEKSPCCLHLAHSPLDARRKRRLLVQCSHHASTVLRLLHARMSAVYFVYLVKFTCMYATRVFCWMCNSVASDTDCTAITNCAYLISVSILSNTLCCFSDCC